MIFQVFNSGVYGRSNAGSETVDAPFSFCIATICNWREKIYGTKIHSTTCTYAVTYVPLRFRSFDAYAGYRPSLSTCICVIPFAASRISFWSVFHQRIVKA